MKPKTKLVELIDKLSAGERAMLQRGLQGRVATVKVHDHTFSGKHIRFGYYSDPHVGQKEFSEELWMKMISFYNREGISTVYCPGDNLEGMSGRPGHIYELAQIGATAQMNYASQLFQVADKLHFFIIDGNHDQWYKEKNSSGLVSGAELAHRNKNVTFLGEWEADVKLSNSVVMKLFHGNDGSAYATSYKIQKLIESLEGGKKPNIILSGHYHKQLALFTRNVFGFECGTLCGQTRWMRGKKLAAHMGFGIIELWVNPRGVERLRHEFIPHFA